MLLVANDRSEEYIKQKFLLLLFGEVTEFAG